MDSGSLGLIAFETGRDVGLIDAGGVVAGELTMETRTTSCRVAVTETSVPSMADEAVWLRH